MRIRLSLAFLIICCFLITTVPAQNSDDPLAKKVDQLFATWDKPESPGAAIAVIKDGVVVYKRGYGSANWNTMFLSHPKLCFMWPRCQSSLPPSL